jgi:putative phosphoesterase
MVHVVAPEDSRDRADVSDPRVAPLVAVLSDVHGNAVALEAVLAELEQLRPDLVVFGGDVTWGSLPEETFVLLARLPAPALYVRGNAERALLQPSSQPTERERWMLEAHSDETLAFLESFVERVTVSVDGLGPVCFCHGSPRSDEELVTPETPEERMRALTAELGERVLVTAHTHLQFDRRVAGIRSVNAGSVGMPYEGRTGAYWALLGPDVELRRTEYSLDEAAERYRASGDPLAEQMVELLVSPPTRAEVIEQAEALEFSG